MGDVSRVDWTLKVQARSTVGLLSGPSGIVSSGTVQSDDADMPVTKDWSDDDRTLAGASETLDLASLPDGQNWTGLKVQIIQIKAHDDNNASGLTFGTGGTNGYNIFGHASGIHTLYPGDELHIKCKDNLQDVGASDKTIDVAGTAGDKYDIQLVAG